MRSHETGRTGSHFKAHSFPKKLLKEIKMHTTEWKNTWIGLCRRCEIIKVAAFKTDSLAT